MAIINIRGANGSGKSTIAKSVGDIPGEVAVIELVQKQPEMKKAITGTLVKHLDTIVIGPYDSNCGGCDKYTWSGSHDQIVEAIEVAAARFSHVVFEGVTITSSFTRYRDLSERLNNIYGQPTYWVMLDFPIDVLVDRVKKRTPKFRDAADEARLRKNIASKVRTMELTYPKLKADRLSQIGVLNSMRFNDTKTAQDWVHAFIGNVAR